MWDKGKTRDVLVSIAIGTLITFLQLVLTHLQDADIPAIDSGVAQVAAVAKYIWR